ncbi:ComF family protein [Desulfovibrio piger]|uniref:ComF family protein n=1 Tax=Desulfovibrio piger TaxID=901 RepID=UPI0026E927DD|nr:phosphoribosyltransferase family protein [Desulfovibrio piger]
MPAGQDIVRGGEPVIDPDAPPRRPFPLIRLARLLGFTEHRCPVCGTPVDAAGKDLSGPEAGMLAHGLCPACARALRPSGGGRCRACGLPLPDAVLGIPQHKDHLRRRGYNQAHELAVALGLMLSLPVRPGLLRRPAAVPHQTGLTASRRRRNVAGTFRADGVRGLRLWLVDDIITTGSTLRAAGEELRRAGAARVDVLALARTPLP